MDGLRRRTRCRLGVPFPFPPGHITPASLRFPIIQLRHRGTQRPLLNSTTNVYWNQIYDSSILRQTQTALDPLESGIDPWRNIFYRTDFERDVCRLMDRVVPISIESNANVFGANSREEGIKPVS